MPSITVDEQDHSLFYEDTGPPQIAEFPYTTLVIVHGTAFHGRIFKRILPLAAQHNLRLVVVNRRDYPNSSPYTEEDLDKIRDENNAELHDAFAKARAAEFARFIRTFIEKEHIPKASSDWKHGGIILMAWSSGSGYTLPLLAYADTIPTSTRESIEPYLRSHIIFDAPRWVLGLPPSDQQYGVPKDEPQEERIRRFSEAVCAYYSHKSLTSHNIADLQFNPSKDARKSTLQSMTIEEAQETTCFPALFRSEIPAQSAHFETNARRLRRALFDDTLAKYLPQCRVDVICCEKSPWESIDVMWNLQDGRKKADEEGISGRPLRITLMPGANHFPHWNEPEMTMSFFANVVNTLDVPVK